MNRIPSLALLLFLPVAVVANDYPTLERVDYVLTCMKREGGQTVDNLYACSCEVDQLAQALPFQAYNDSRTFESYRNMPGEKGSVFRESKEGEDMVVKLKKVREDARKRCFIGRPAPAAVRSAPPG